MKIKIYGILKQYASGKELLEIYIKERIKVSDIFSRIGIPEKYVFIVEKDGKSIEKDAFLDNDDEISLIPFISGG